MHPHEPSPRARIAIAWSFVLLAAPIAVQAVTRLLSAWTGEPHHALVWTALALAPILLTGLLAVLRGALTPRLGLAFGVLTGAVAFALTDAPLPALATALTTAYLGAPAFARLAERPPVPRGRVAAGFYALLSLLAVVQVARMSVYMADPHERWGALSPSADFMATHSCLTSYVHGVQLARAGDANIYDDRYGSSPEAPPELPSRIDPGPLTMDTYEYPPQFLVIPRVMVALTTDFMAIRAVWFALTALVFAAVGVALARWLGGDIDRRARLLLPAVAMSPPALIVAYFGNFQLMAMALSALAMLAIYSGRTRSGSLLLALMIGAKIFPGILGVYLIAARRFAAVAWTAAFGVLHVLVTYLLFGARPFVDFFAYHLPRLASGETFAFLSEPMPTMSNLGVFGVPFKLRVLGWAGSEAEAWALAGRISWAYTLVVVLVAALAGWRRPATRDPRERMHLLCGWFGLLALGAMRSPFAPPEALIPVVWAFSLRAAASRRRAEVVAITLLWIASLIVIPVPTPITAAISLLTQSLVYAACMWLALAGRTPLTQGSPPAARS